MDLLRVERERERGEDKDRQREKEIETGVKAREVRLLLMLPGARLLHYTRPLFITAAMCPGPRRARMADMESL